MSLWTMPCRSGKHSSTINAMPRATTSAPTAATVIVRVDSTSSSSSTRCSMAWRWIQRLEARTANRSMCATRGCSITSAHTSDPIISSSDPSRLVDASIDVLVMAREIDDEMGGCWRVRESNS